MFSEPTMEKWQHVGRRDALWTGLGKGGEVGDDEQAACLSLLAWIALTMPATFDDFGIKFLYPDNWSVLGRDESEGQEGVTLELPTGGFFSIERGREGDVPDAILDSLASSFENEYGEVEREELPGDSDAGIERAVEFRFYYLDLLITSRLLFLTRHQIPYVIQMQAESRDFDTNEQVFEAIVQQLLRD